MITITFPDNSIKQFDDFPTGMDVAKSISEGFARNCVAMKINGQLLDLSRPIEADTQIGFITANDDIALEVLRHSAAHVMAEAVLNLYPEAKLTIGPVVEDGFYYDIDMPPVSEDDLSRIETEIQKIIKAKNTFERQVVSKEKALEIFKDNPFKCELINELSDQEISLYQNGAFIDLCRGPHIPHTGMIKGIKLMKISGAYWRADPSREQLQRLYGTAFFDKKKLNQYLHLIEEAKNGTIARWAPGWTCTRFMMKPRAWPFSTPKAWTCGTRCWITGGKPTGPQDMWKPRPRSFSTENCGKKADTGTTIGKTCTPVSLMTRNTQSNP